MQVLGALLPPVPPPAEEAPAASGAPTAAPGTTTLNEQQEIVILSVTAQQAEVIRYAQLQANPLLTLSLVLRSPDDFIDPATGQPATPVLAETTGVTLKILARPVRRPAAGHPGSGPPEQPAPDTGPTGQPVGEAMPGPPGSGITHRGQSPQPSPA